MCIGLTNAIDFSICTGETQVLPQNSNTTNYKWLEAHTNPSIGTLDDINSLTPLFTPENPGRYLFYQISTISNSKIGDSIISVHVSPGLLGISLSETSVCAGQEVLVNLDSESEIYSVGGVGIESPFENMTVTAPAGSTIHYNNIVDKHKKGAYLPITLGSAGGTITVSTQKMDDASCQASYSASVTISSGTTIPETPNLFVSGHTICPKSNYSISVGYSQTGNTYSVMNLPGSTYLGGGGGQGSFGMSYRASTESGLIEAIATNSQGCKAKSYKYLYVKEPMPGGLTVSANSICEYQNYVFNVSRHGLIGYDYDVEYLPGSTYNGGGGSQFGFGANLNAGNVSGDVILTTTDLSGCEIETSEFISVDNNCKVDFAGKALNSSSLYPNPVVDGRTKVNFESENQAAYFVLNSTGNIVIEGRTYSGEELFTNGLTSGIYTLNIEVDGKREIHQLFIQ